ncbi:MAG: adenylate/guanylate cyclase domain-containing protein [Lachnospiraceae bacterium]|nr:adenylate/guanylate cyclase domain-containing protein [Lachnospiraceae bacterium]
MARIPEILAASLLVFLLCVTNLFSKPDYFLRDKLYQIPRGISNSIKIIGIDEATLDAYGPLQTWPRSRYAELLEVLGKTAESQPSVIGFDIQFSGLTGEGDDGFAEAASKSGNVVIVEELIYGEKGYRDAGGVMHFPVEGISKPYDGLGSACRVGYSNVSEDSDGIVRRILPAENFGGSTHEAFSRVLYDAYCEKEGLEKKTIPSDKSGRSLINYSGKPGDYEMIPLKDVLEGKIDPRAFAGSIVLVGAYAPGMQDNYKVPNSGSDQMYGVEIHANILQSYLDGRFSINGNPYHYALVLALLMILLQLCFRRFKPWQSFLIMVLTDGAVIASVVMLNERGRTYPILYLPLVALIFYIYTLAVHYVEEVSKRRKVLQAFKKYVAPEVVEEIAKKGNFEIKLGGENRDIAVLFVDIRGFTTMSEALEPEKVVEILNEYLALTTKSIFDNGGTLDKFVGDATMAVFNSPFDVEDYEYKAVCAAMDIVKGGQELEKVLLEKYGRCVGFGVGVHCGRAVVGNVGCEFRMDFTAIGDTVNTAARLEANAGKGQVLISDVLYERLKDRISVNEIGRIPLKGKSNGVMVYEVTQVEGHE